MLNTKSRTQTLVMTAMMTAVLAVLSPMSIPVTAIPITLAVFAVYLTGALLPPVSAAGAIAIYLLLGGVGLPVFSNYRGGPQMLVGPTGGYLFGYFIIVAVVALATRRTDALHWQLMAGTAALAAFYLVGTLWYMVVTQADFLSGLMMCVVPFVVPDLVKMTAALALAKVLRQRLRTAAG